MILWVVEVHVLVLRRDCDAGLDGVKGCDGGGGLRELRH